MMHFGTFINEIKSVSILKTLYYNFLSTHVNRNHGMLVVYRGTSFHFEKGSSIIINDGMFFLGRSSGVSAKTNVRLQTNSRLFSFGNTTIEYGADILLKTDAQLTLKNNSYFNCRAMIRCHYRISVGENALISSDLDLRDSDGHSINGVCKTEEVIIGNRVWIGNNVGILKGVIIGSGSMIGARALITKSIPDNCLAYGIPAIVHKENIQWE